MVIEYSGIVIRSILTDKREKYYESKVSTPHSGTELATSTIFVNKIRFFNLFIYFYFYFFIFLFVCVPFSMAKCPFCPVKYPTSISHWQFGDVHWFIKHTSHDKIMHIQPMIHKKILLVCRNCKRH